ncbi:2OG-Fe(II) oxygenase [Allosphingosinicella sp.]|jgi:PKHD-type hydroxylase|uniref:2OG-Fe(II) oxygenase n=1 Tax=Allosphingosinicella sp. TaxID=2823234 RepID=UPI002F09370A
MPMIWDWEGAFSGLECDVLVELMEGSGGVPAPVYGQTGERAVDPAVRNVVSAFQERSAETAWLFDRLDGLFAEAGRFFGTPLAPLSEPVQLLRYDSGGHFVSWHSDSGADLQGRRRVSVSVELSNARDYQGGLLEIVPGTVGRARTLPRGGARFFPSAAIHRVTPVTRGTRYALVGWTGDSPG